MTDEHMAYVGFCPDCEAMVCAVVDNPEHRRGRDGSARTVADWMREGMRIERVTCQFVRESLAPCLDTCSCKWCVKKRGKLATKTAAQAQLEIPNASKASVDLLGSAPVVEEPRG